MNYEKLKNFRLWDTLDTALSKRRFSGIRRDSLYPSEASAIKIDPITHKAEVIGACTRKIWYRLFKIPESNPITLKTAYTFEFGIYIEKLITELCKLAGIYNNSSVKFWSKETGTSGEIDIVVEVPNENNSYVFVEVKSTWGGNIVNGNETGKAKDLFDRLQGRGKDRKNVHGRPKEANVLQIVTYLFKHKDDPKLLGGKLIYLLRDNFNRTEFDIHLEVLENGKHGIFINGILEEGYYAESIEERSLEVLTKARADSELLRQGFSPTPPPREYYLVYPDEILEEKYKAEKVSKTAYENHKKNVTKAGDWQCSYCNWKKTCWSLP